MGAVRLNHWAQQFFGSLYGEIYRTSLMTGGGAKAEAAFAREQLQLEGKRVLDLACGYGRHAKHLAANNTVCGVDTNTEYLRAAVQLVRGKAAQNFKPIRADMRRLPIPSATIDAVLLLFNSFGYFAPPACDVSTGAAPRQQVWKLPQVFYDRELVPQTFGTFGDGAATNNAPNSAASADSDQNAEVLREISRVLRVRGELLIELPNLKPLLSAVEKTPRRHQVSSKFEIEEQYDWDPELRTLHNRTRFRIKERIEEGEYRIRLYTLKEMRELAAACGFTIVRTWGSYDGEKYSPSQSPLLLIHARKKA